MIFLYLIAVLIVNIAGVSPQVIDGINTCFNSDLSGVALFWYGLLIAFIVGLLTD